MYLCTIEAGSIHNTKYIDILIINWQYTAIKAQNNFCYDVKQSRSNAVVVVRKMIRAQIKILVVKWRQNYVFITW